MRSNYWLTSGRSPNPGITLSSTGKFCPDRWRQNPSNTFPAWTWRLEEAAERLDEYRVAQRQLSGYADYMQTDEFEESLGELLSLKTGRRVAIMCAEAVPWRCHRSMIADALTARGIPVVHLMSPVKADPHKLTSFARVAGGRVSYPSPDLDLF